MMRKLFAVFPAFLFLAFAWTPKGLAQPFGRVVGVVLDAQTSQPLPGATILFARERGIVTSPDGTYQLNLEPGSHTITFRYVGYRQAVHQVQLAENETVQLDVLLDPAVTEIDQVVVSASRFEQRLSELTVSVSLIRPEALSDAHIGDPKELLNRLSGVEVLDGQASIRGGSGFSYGAGSRVLALVDGLPIISPDAGGVRWRSLPLENLSQIEVIKGASSVLYGSSALNGIISFRTAAATEKGETDFFVETGMFGQPRQKDWVWWDSPRTHSSASFSHLKKYRNTEVGIGSYAFIDNGYRRLNDERLGRVNLRLRHHDQQVSGLSYGLNFNGGINHKRDFILWEDAWQGALKQDESTEAELQAGFFYLDPFVSLARDGRFSHDLRMRLQGSQNRFPVTTNNNSDTRSLFSEYQTWYAIGDGISLNAGLMYYISQIRSAFYGDHDGRNAAVYAQAEADLLQRLKMVGGVRFEHNVLDGKSDKVVPLFRFGLNYQVGEITFLRASYGQGYRFPSVAEKHASTTLGAVRIFPSPDLMPEKGWNSEIGIKQGILTPNWNGLVDLAVFYGENKDMIEYVFGVYTDPYTGAFDMGFRARNIEYSRVYGTEIEFRLTNSYGRFNNNISGGYVYMYPVEFNPLTKKNTGVLLKFRRHHSARIGLTTAVGAFEAGLDLFVRSRILNIDDVFLNPLTRETILPGFYDYWQENNTGHFLGDLTLGYNFHPRYKVSLAIKNLTNAEYMGRPGDIQPHRNISIRLSGSL
jgi:outer membrane receptor protein involved in Fe transport